MVDFQISKDFATDLVKCLDGIAAEEVLDSATVKIQPASTTKQSLTKAFDVLTSKAAELSSALVAHGDTVRDVEEKVKFL